MKYFKLITIPLMAILNVIVFLWKMGVFNYRPHKAYRSIALKQRDVSIGRYGHSTRWGGHYK